MSKITVHSEKAIFNAGLFTVSKLKLSSSNGGEYSHIVARRVPTVCVFPINDSYDIYLISQHRYLVGKEMIEAVAGFVDKGETTVDAARRELKEETGIEALQLEEIARFDLSASVFQAVSHIFLAKTLEFGESKPEEQEFIKIIKMPIKIAIKKIINGEICDSSTVAGILLLDTMRRERKI